MLKKHCIRKLRPSLFWKALFCQRILLSHTEKNRSSCFRKRAHVTDLITHRSCWESGLTWPLVKMCGLKVVSSFISLTWMLVLHSATASFLPVSYVVWLLLDCRLHRCNAVSPLVVATVYVETLDSWTEIMELNIICHMTDFPVKELRVSSTAEIADICVRDLLHTLLRILLLDSQKQTRAEQLFFSAFFVCVQSFSSTVSRGQKLIGYWPRRSESRPLDSQLWSIIKPLCTQNCCSAIVDWPSGW